MKAKLFTAIAQDEIIHFDSDGRIYELNTQIDSYLPTEQFVHLDYYGIAMLMLPPEFVQTGWREPIENYVEYEIYDE